MTGIIILNWNGWEDTIDCLKSQYKTIGSDFFVILVDNGSADDSIEHLKEYIIQEGITLHIFNGDDSNLPSSISHGDIILYPLGENYGFAKGNNKGLELAKRYSPEYCLLLNNDTVVTPNYLSKLEEFINTKVDYSVLTPMICFYSDKNIVWNCGGSITFGFRKYFYPNKAISSIREKTNIDISFITGCALFFRTKLIASDQLLTERFFHGEEDFDFSMRMQSKNVKMACVLDSVIYHKVGRATKKLNNLGKTYAHYLNRYIDMRLKLSSFKYSIWKFLSNAYIFVILYRQRVNIGKIFHFLKKLNLESASMDCVTKEKFFNILKEGI